ncbi:carboxypeptidase-like regulatory domain-containing protein [Parvicella tangerina]|uniref:Carboxypeptidase-like regulatory domain-containing protein n=1 Tax=Parvicella tangerina TaxID=2829795 RepID=A0A916NI16_9FLAO|nr:carboxypeptidase-like regulatory domain-containing protein [Parvicella tangerina]CAG5084210.1 hypothetical protein CRYO30217_02406 [Parvicella tangerina]
MSFSIVPCLKKFNLDSENTCNLCRKRIIHEAELDTSSINPEEEICVITTLENVSSKYLLHPMRVFGLSVFIVFGSSLFTIEAQGQENLMNLQNNQRFVQAEIRGTVYDKETSEPLPFVKIKVKDHEFGCMSDLDGHFKLKLDVEHTSGPLTIQFLCVGFKDFELTTENKLKADEVLYLGDIFLEADYHSISVGILIETDPQINFDPDAHRSTTIKSEEIKRSPYRD